MSSTELFKKHFGEKSALVDLKHPNMEAFFEELNEECLEEDRISNSSEIQICYKTNKPCKFNCKGLCKESF